MKIILRINWSRKKEVSKKTKASIEKNCINLFSLYLRNFVSQPVSRVIYLINPILRGWVNYFRIGHSSKCLGYVKGWVEKKIRRHLQRARKRHGFGWNRWSSAWLYNTLGLYNDYKIRYYHA